VQALRLSREQRLGPSGFRLLFFRWHALGFGLEGDRELGAFHESGKFLDVVFGAGIGFAGLQRTGDGDVKTCFHFRSPFGLGARSSKDAREKAALGLGEGRCLFDVGPDTAQGVIGGCDLRPPSLYAMAGHAALRGHASISKPAFALALEVSPRSFDLCFGKHFVILH
jgi:hypothetical protein